MDFNDVRDLEARFLLIPFQVTSSCDYRLILLDDTHFCLDEISFRRDYKSCRIGVVRSSSFDVPHLWKLCDGITSVILELAFWDLVHCLLISFCFGSEILKKNRTTPTPKKNQKTPKKDLWIFTMGYLANALS